MRPRAAHAWGLAILSTVLASSSSATPAASPGQIAFVRTGEHGRDIGELYVMNADGRGQRNLTRREHDDHSPRWSPNGRRIAFVAQHAGITDIYVANADGGPIRRVTRSSWSDSPVWSPDGRQIAFVRHFLDPPGNETGDTTPEIHVVNADGTRPKRLTRNRLHEFALDWSRRGRLAFVRAPRLEPEHWTGAEVFVMNPDGSGVRRLTRNGVREDGVSWSPDGRRLAFVRWERDQQRSAIYVMNADGSGERRLIPVSRTEDGRSDLATRLVWSPDGRRIATNWGARDDIYVLNADGSGRRRLAGRYPGLPSWSPDGRIIAFHRHPAIYTVNANGGGERRLVPLPGRPPFSLGENWAPAWSPRP